MKPKQGILELYKERGETPLECLQRFRKENPKYKDEKMTYAGRLDPLAEGLLLAVTGEEIKNKEKYLNLDKEYEVSILFGFSTDTYDILGIITERIKNNSKIKIPSIHILQSFIRKFNQKYPAYSSKTIKGKPLFSLARIGQLDEQKIPTKKVEIKNIELIDQKTISRNDLKKYIYDSLKLVSGDFRQEKILKIWNRELGETTFNEFPIVSIRVSCTSGTYMRSLAYSIGNKVNIPTLALNIKRTKIGKSHVN